MNILLRPDAPNYFPQEYCPGGYFTMLYISFA
jgi:hypothetical protein